MGLGISKNGAAAETAMAGRARVLVVTVVAAGPEDLEDLEDLEDPVAAEAR